MATAAMESALIVEVPAAEPVVGRYRAELAEHAKELAAVRTMVRGRAATLITAAREVDLSHAVVMRGILRRKTK